MRWNNDEFEVNYGSLKNLYKVGKYFLAVLLNEKPVVPYMIEVITSPLVFWNELNVRFHCTDDINEQTIIVKVLISMYQKHYQMLKDFESIPFWVKCLTHNDRSLLHFWILQLLYVAISIPFPEYAKQNFKMFKKVNGMSALFGVLNSTFKELNNSNDDEIEDERSQVNTSKISNYTGIKENLFYFERNSDHINKSIVIFNILNYLHGSMEDAQCVPIPSFIQYLNKKRSVNVIVQLMLLENEDLNKVILNFITKRLKCHYSLTNLLENGIVEALLLNLHTKNGKKALLVLDRINEFEKEYNDDLNFVSKVSWIS